MQPPHAQTLEKLMREIDEAIDRDRQFIIESQELRSKWRQIVRLVNQRLHKLMKTGPHASSSSTEAS